MVWFAKLVGPHQRARVIRRELWGNPELILAELQRGDLLQAASYGFHRLTRPQIGAFVRQACRYGTARPHEVHRKIVSLGPRCYITTNYDNLIEKALEQWQPERFYPPAVTNRQLTETAEIVHARAIDFVFKPHGDAADSESIILTREQYRLLLPGGERHAALETTKMLLASRPVVYLGFGLRDPDFTYLRDLLANTYKGGIRDHYAIIADTGEAEGDYWRANYGIHLVSYQTSLRTDGTTNHDRLLSLLDSLIPEPNSPVSVEGRTPSDDHCSPNTILALARHAGRLIRTPKNNPEFPISVTRSHYGRSDSSYNIDPFDGAPIIHFLDRGPRQALILGTPGAGKSYALQQAAARIALTLHDQCLAESFPENEVIVPVIADLKVYAGNLYELLDGTLSVGLSLDDICSRFKVKVFLDSFNEMPRDYWEDGTYEVDFIQFIERMPSVGIVLGSRSADGLSKIKFPCYELDRIDEHYVDAELGALNIEIDGRFDREIKRLLQQPFYFRLLTRRLVNLQHTQHPRDFYKSFFDTLNNNYALRFSGALDLELALSHCAYRAIDVGGEAQPLSDILATIGQELRSAGQPESGNVEITNWLVSQDIFVPYRGSKLAFFHQSATEYLAACELARRYQQEPLIIKEKLSLTRWDQALFLTLSLLPPNDSASFLTSVIEADFILAMRAAKYLEVDRDRVVSRLLSEIPRHTDKAFRTQLDIENAILYSLPITVSHEPELRELMRLGGSIAAGAVEKLVELRGELVKDELLAEMVRCSDDYNYCANGIAPALQSSITADDVSKILLLSDSLTECSLEATDDEYTGLISGVETLLKLVPLGEIRSRFLSKGEVKDLSPIRSLLLCSIIHRRHSTEALELAAALLENGVNQAATTIYFIAHFHDGATLSWGAFNAKHIQRLITTAESDKENWSLKSLGLICAARTDLRLEVQQHAKKSSGIAKAALLFAADPSDFTAIFGALKELLQCDTKFRDGQPIELIQHIEIPWKGQEKLFVDLLNVRDTRLALALLESVDEDSLSGFDLGHSLVWLLEWIAGETDGSRKYWLAYRLSLIIAAAPNVQAGLDLLAEFNNPSSQYRRLLARHILIRFTDITSDQFSEDAISFLLSELRHPGVF